MKNYTMDDKALTLLIAIKVAMWMTVVILPCEMIFDSAKLTATNLLISVVLLVISLVTKITSGGKRIL